jgi:hypothetical protein
MAMCWDVLIEQEQMNDYLFHEHFIMLIWKRHIWFGVRYLAHFISAFVNQKAYLQEDESFWLDELLPKMEGMFTRELHAQSIRNMIQALSDLEV